MSLFSYCTTGLVSHLFPKYKLIDNNNIKIVETEYGKFHYSEPLQNYPNLFDEVSDYKIDDLQTDDVVLDIGACVGASTIMFAKKCKFVHAVEPLFIEELIENLELNSIHNASVFSFALGSSGVISFCGKETKVVGCTLSELLNVCDPKPTFLKMDCEGGEWSINPEDLAGFRAIEAEIHKYNKHKPKKFIKMLIDIGFKVDSWKTPEGQTMVSARRA